MRWRVSFAWYDLWVGVFIDPRKRKVYVCPLPTLLIEGQWGAHDHGGPHDR